VNEELLARMMLLGVGVIASAFIILIFLFFRKTTASIKSSSPLFQRPLSYLSIIFVVLWFVLLTVLGGFEERNLSNLLLPVFSTIILTATAYLVIIYNFIAWTKKWYGIIIWIVFEFIILIFLSINVFMRHVGLD
jgi:hypothetical protein